MHFYHLISPSTMFTHSKLALENNSTIPHNSIFCRHLTLHPIENASVGRTCYFVTSVYILLFKSLGSLRNVLVF